MAIERKKAVQVSASFIALAISGVAFFAMFGPEGCGMSEDERQLLMTLNSLDEIADKGARVERVTRTSDGDAGVYRYEAEIFNRDGVAIGRLRGGRVEGFGTMRPRFLWYEAPGVPEE
jgi:hypothetical protein